MYAYSKTFKHPTSYSSSAAKRFLQIARYGIHRWVTDPIGTFDEVRARLASPRHPERSVAELPYVQITGAVKSGTSMVASLFDGAPGVASYPHDSTLTGWNYEELRDADPKQVEPFLIHLTDKWLTSNGRYRSLDSNEWNPTFSAAFVIRVRRNLSHLLQTCDTFWEMHAAFLDAYLVEAALDNEFTTWIDKSPFAHRYFEEIKRARPEAKFIHVLRHPAGTLSSKAIKYIRTNASDQQLDDLTEANRLFIVEAFKCAAKYRNNPDYAVVRYEDICSNPEREVESMREFVGIPPSANLYKPTLANAPFPGNNWEGQVFTGISSHSIHRWRRRLPSHYTNAVCYEVVDLMQEFGYEPPADHGNMERDYREHMNIMKQSSPDPEIASDAA